jgi:hypothetical protein
MDSNWQAKDAAAKSAVQSPSPGTTAPAPTEGAAPGSLLWVPRTEADVEGLHAKRSELSNQLESVADRVRSVNSQLNSTPGEARPALVEYANALNARRVFLENELSIVGQQLANAPLTLVPSTAPPLVPPLPGSFGSGELAGLITVFVLFPIALAVARLIWKRATTRPQALADAESAQRLRRLEAAVDAVAIEVERISEGQRFLTKLFAKEQRAGIAIPAATDQEREQRK